MNKKFNKQTGAEVRGAMLIRKWGRRGGIQQKSLKLKSGGYACLALESPPRLRNTFGFASILLDTKGAVKRNYDVPITSTSKRKKHKVRDKSIQTYF